MINYKHESSFRDSSGYVFKDNQGVKRSINPIYFKTYDILNSSGFYKSLFSNKLLIPHKEIGRSEENIIIHPEQIPFIHYPYEWCFNQYKEAALLTLKIQKFSLEHNFSLKDASAYNIAFHKGRAVFIDTLSFDVYQDNTPWRAYRQFIMHFLGPLVIARYHGSEILKMMSVFMEGIPLKMLSSMLPYKTKFNPFLYSNIHLLSKFEDKHSEDYKGESKKAVLSKKGQLNIIESLYDYIKKLSLKENSEWGNYYTKMNYTDDSFKLKSKIINDWMINLKPKTLIDVGGNNGAFVREIKVPLDEALVGDIDNNAVDCNYALMKMNKEQFMKPLILDILNPSASIGFNNKERASFIHRIKHYAPDVTLALALIHHISLSGNVPFDMSAKFFATFSKHLIIEFPKREDSWVQHLLSSKREFQNHFNFYTIKNFKKDYESYFETMEEISIDNSERVLFLLKRKNDI